MKSPYDLPTDCVACDLRSDDFFCALPLESSRAFDRIKHSVVLPEGASIFVEGQASHGVFMLCQGLAKMSTTSRKGKTFILRIALRVDS